MYILYICIYVHNIYIHIRIYIHVHACMYAYIVCTYTCIYIYVHVYICIYICLQVNTFAKAVNVELEIDNHNEQQAEDKNVEPRTEVKHLR